jgi:hypothetical protein
MSEVKTCTVCTETKSLFDFSVDRSKSSRYKSSCKSCNNTAIKKWREDNKEYRLSYDKQYRTINKDKIRIRNQKRYTGLTLDQKFEQLLKTAQKRKTVKVFISVEHIKDAWKKQEGRCAYTKLPLTSEAHQLNTVSLDRIDSSKDYVEGNIQLVCVPINVMKMDSTEEQFIHFCSLVTQNNKLSESPESLTARYISLGT